MVWSSVARMSEALPLMKPLFDRVLIKRAAPKTKTAGGIMLPASETDKFVEGVVVAVGPGARTEAGSTIPVQLKAGDRVVLPEYGGQKLRINQEDFEVFKEPDVVGILR